jgi:hypothetical protein
MDLTKLSIAALFRIVKSDWKKPYFGAVPYIDALITCQSMDSVYGVETARDLVPYFLANANTWRGETAKAVKLELKSRLANR